MERSVHSRTGVHVAFLSKARAKAFPEIFLAGSYPGLQLEKIGLYSTIGWPGCCQGPAASNPPGPRKG